MRQSNFDKIFNQNPQDSFVEDLDEPKRRTGDELKQDVEEALPPALVSHDLIQPDDIDDTKIFADYNFARLSLIELATKAQQTLQVAIDNAVTSGKASDIDSVTSLLGTNAEIVTHLTELNLKHKETRARLEALKDNVPQEINNSGTVNNFNIGNISTAELLKLINETQNQESKEE